MQTQLPDMLPETVNFLRQVELRRTIEGVYPISRLKRLTDILLIDEGFVTVKLEFGQSVGFASLKGMVSAKMMAQCQRCLEPMETEVTGSFKFALVNNEEELELLPEELEPYLLVGEEQSIIGLVEDELLLSLPMVTAHKTDCSDYMSKQNSEIKAAIKAEKKASHPFAALKDLKGDKAN